MKIVPVILAGGLGSRLWPLSRSAYPKQYHRFLSSDSLFQAALYRAQHISEQVLILAGEEQRFLVLEQSANLNASSRIILEPIRKDTAPILALAAHHLITQNDPLMLVIPADQMIAEPQIFYESVKNASLHLQKKNLLLFACPPTHPHTGYGYLQRGEACGKRLYKMRHFVEKPSFELAKDFIAAGDYYWNSGLFLFRASALLNELSQFDPATYEATKKAALSMTFDGVFLRPGPAFSDSPVNSIDYAVMEHTQNACLTPVDMKWNDLGSWQSLHACSPKTKKGNTCLGDVFTKAVENSYIHSTNRLVMALGLKNLIVVETRDAVLIADKNQDTALKLSVKQLEALNRPEVISHSRVYRPWGYYEVLESGKCFQIKRLCVKPDAALSLQMHQHRSEHWVVLSGQAEVHRGDDVFSLHHDQSAYIPNKTKHRLKNIGQDTLEVIEIQVGDYLGEDDIHRFEDQYGRSEKLPEKLIE